MKTDRPTLRLLIIDDEENMRHMLEILLSKSGYQVTTARDGRHGLEIVQNDAFDFILCDLKMPNLDGMGFLKAAESYLTTTTVIVMSAYGTIDTAIDAMKCGAYDYISKPFKTDEVLLALKKAEEREALRRENIWLKERLRTMEGNYRFANMVGKSPKMQAVFKLASKAAQYDTTVLIFGGSGTGKELIARGIHFSSPRSDQPFIPVNCGGIPENLLESEFFGYRKGAFTGADKDRKGLFEEADGGTIFLDEIGELPLSMQVKFLRVLQENEVRPIGGAKTKKIDVRVITATSRNLSEEVENGTFRQDLYYRLNVLPVGLPALKDRPEDIPLLCNHFIDRFNKNLKKKIEGISGDAMQMLLRHTWPGNVRELENVIERAVILADESVLMPEHFPFSAEKQPTPGAADAFDTLFKSYSLKEAQKILEEKMIIRALSATEGNRTRATQLLEISHPSLLSKIKAYNISL